MNAQPVAFSVFGRFTRQVEVLFSDDQLTTVSRAKDGTYRAHTIKADSSSGYGREQDAADPYTMAAVRIARIHI